MWETARGPNWLWWRDTDSVRNKGSYEPNTSFPSKRTMCTTGKYGMTESGKHQFHPHFCLFHKTSHGHVFSISPLPQIHIGFDRVSPVGLLIVLCIPSTTSTPLCDEDQLYHIPDAYRLAKILLETHLSSWHLKVGNVFEIAFSPSKWPTVFQPWKSSLPLG